MRATCLRIMRSLITCGGPKGQTATCCAKVVHRLRNKIEPDPSEPTYIETVPGLGYGLSVPPEH